MKHVKVIAAASALVALGCGAATSARQPDAQPGASALPESHAPKAGRTAADAKTPLFWVSLPAGQFTAGCESQNDCPPKAGPAHSASVAAFDMMQTEVTVEAFALCVAAGVCTAPGTGAKECNGSKGDLGKHPANCVDQSQAAVFCGWVGGRLPTPDEWEYAAKSGAKRLFPWGDALPDETRAQYDKAGTAPVGSHPAGATPWGLQDLAGNVGEWTSGELSKGVIELRGGSFGFPEPRRLRTDSRGGAPPTLKAGNVGFRCAREPQH
jgi:formylglycine-generating enzyme required for sulfatase activity